MFESRELVAPVRAVVEVGHGVYPDLWNESIERSVSSKERCKGEGEGRTYGEFIFVGHPVARSS